MIRNGWIESFFQMNLKTDIKKIQSKLQNILNESLNYIYN